MIDNDGDRASGDPPDPDPKPVPPNQDDYSGCCDSGCTPCVYDLYWEALARYEETLAAWEQRHPQDSA